ncbi:IscS subfamily cysteine desulfurase [Candidatus Hamiltonella endosymbiont of Tuberolachnus salignus]|uniref:IscS subfamily cysteine desulfurase n=1 Tax=Candidatus Williamhamiltonella endosymbiont of Tuberolachnus salignus TaxID=3077954 RepID=UPI0030CCD056
MKRPIYLDYCATTPVDKRVADKMMSFLTIEGTFGNPASRSHFFGWQAEEAVDIARNQIASLLGADAREIIFTSGATESNNLAIKGTAHFYKKKGKHIVTCQTEHKSVLDSCAQLEREGFSVTYLSPKSNGLIDLEKFESALKKNTILVSVMHVNNETGVIQNIAHIGRICREKGIFFHVDAAQSAGKLPINLSQLSVDFMSISAHKMYGPMGIGALFVRRKPAVHLEPIQHGGGHERGLRSGTLPVHQIVGMGEACRIAEAEMSAQSDKMNILGDQLWYGLQHLDHIYLNGDLKNKVPHIFNISFGGINGEALILSLKDLAVSSGSACISSTVTSSYVLRALEVSDELAQSTIRFSFGRFTTQKEIEYAIELIPQYVLGLRKVLSQ